MSEIKCKKKRNGSIGMVENQHFVHCTSFNSRHKMLMLWLILLTVGLLSTGLTSIFYWNVKHEQQRYLLTRCPVLDLTLTSVRCCVIQSNTCQSDWSIMWGDGRSCEDSSMQQDRQYCLNIKGGTCCMQYDGNNHCLASGINLALKLCGNCSTYGRCRRCYGTIHFKAD